MSKKKKEAICESVGVLDDVEVFAKAKLKDYEDSYISATEDVEKDDSASIANGIEIFKRIYWYMNTAELLNDAKRKYAIVKQNEERKQNSESRRVNRKKAVRKRYITASIIIVIIAGLAAVAVMTYFIPNKKYTDTPSSLVIMKYIPSIPYTPSSSIVAIILCFNASFLVL